MNEKIIKILAFILVIIIGYGIFSYNQEDVPIGFGCYYEKATLLNQRIDTTSNTYGGDCSKGCLFMDVYTEHFDFMECGHLDKVTMQNKTYFFANEGIRGDLHNNDSIIVEWCYINEKIGHRIRNIKKGE